MFEIPLKVVFRSKKNKKYVHHCFIASKNLWNNAQVEYIDSYELTRAYSLLNHSFMLKLLKEVFNRSVIKEF